MKKLKVITLGLCAALVLSCSTKTGTGALIGTGAGTFVGGVIGKIAGNTAVGAVVGAAVGAGTGALIGKHMDKVKAETEAQLAEEATVEEVTDKNGLKAVKVTFDSGILFTTGSSSLSSSAKSSLSKFANNVLRKNASVDVNVYGYTDNQGWKNSTAEQSVKKNLDLSQERAQSVASYLLACGAASDQIQAVEGMGESNPVADNSTEAGREQNRRVEVYLYASQEMIDAANAGTLN